MQKDVVPDFFKPREGAIKNIENPKEMKQGCSGMISNAEQQVGVGETIRRTQMISCDLSIGKNDHLWSRNRVGVFGKDENRQ